MAFEKIVISDSTNHALSRLSSRLISYQSADENLRPFLYPQPTVLEPPYRPLRDIRDLRGMPDKPDDIIYESPDKQRQLCRHNILPSTDYEYRWDRTDIFLRHLATLKDRCGLEIIGNSRKIKFRFLCDKSDLPVLSTAFSAKFLDCALRESNPEFFDQSYDHLVFRDYYGPGIYSHLLTQPSAIKTSVYETLLFVLSTLSTNNLGFCQVLFKATRPEHNWHQNVKTITDTEYFNGQLQIPGRYPQQPPSTDLRGTSLDIDTKSHPDKPFFGAAVRIGICGDDEDDCRRMLECLCSCRNLFRHSGQALRYIASDEYGGIDLYELFEKGLVYHPGTLVNSSELSGWAHVPPIDLFKQTSCKLKTVDPLFRKPMGVVSMDINQGTLIGHRQTDQGQEPVVIPDKIAKRHCHIIGKPDRGKSLCCENMAINKINRGQGVAVIDAHGDMINRLLDRIPEEAVERTILFDPSDPEWIPLYNPLSLPNGADCSLAANNFVKTLKSVFSDGWGMRMERILYNLIYLLTKAGKMSFFELMELLRKGQKRDDIVARLNDVITNEEALSFLNDEFKNYRFDELGPAINRLSPLTHSETMSLSLFQPENRFDFQKIIDDGMILLINLASLGREQKISMGGFMINSMFCAVLQRSCIPEEERKLFSFFVDEAHLFQTDALEGMMDEARKFNVSFNLSHQRLNQFKRERADSIVSAATTIAFCLAPSDASVIRKNISNLVKNDEEFMNLEQGQAMVRVDNDAAKITTLGPTKVTQSYREQIINNCHRRYYKKASHIREENRFRFREFHASFGNSFPDDLNLQADGTGIGNYDRYE